MHLSVFKVEAVTRFSRVITGDLYGGTYVPENPVAVIYNSDDEGSRFLHDISTCQPNLHVPEYRTQMGHTPAVLGY